MHPTDTAAAQPSTRAKTVALPLRNDTILGVCEAIGEDFRIPANAVRILFAGTFYIAPYVVIGTYLGLGLVVAISRWAYPKLPADERISPTAQSVAECDEAADELPLAA